MVSDANFFDLTENQRKLLKQVFDKFEQPDEAILEELVKLTGLNVLIVKAWFKNERKKEKKRRKEEQKKGEKMLKKRNKQKGAISDSSYSDLSDQTSSSSGDDSSSSSSSSSEEEEEESEKEEKKPRKEILEEKETKLLEAFFQRQKKGVAPNSAIIEELAGKLNVRTKLVEDWCRQNCGEKKKIRQNNGMGGQNKGMQSGAKIIVGNSVANQPSTSSSSAAAANLGTNQPAMGMGVGKTMPSAPPKAVVFKGNPQTDQNGIQKIGGGGNGADGPVGNILWQRIVLLILLFIAMTIFLLLNFQTKGGEGILEKGNENEAFLGLKIGEEGNKNKTEGNYGKIKRRKSTAAKEMGGFEDLEKEQFYGPEFEILPLEGEIGIGKMNVEKLLNGMEFEESELGEGGLGGLEWGLAVGKRKAKMKNEFIGILLRAKSTNYAGGEKYEVKAKVDFIIELAPSKYRNVVGEYAPIIHHSRQCNFDSKNGGKCGLIVGIRNLKDQMVRKTGKSAEYLGANMVAKIKSRFKLDIPATKESIENI